MAGGAERGAEDQHHLAAVALREGEDADKSSARVLKISDNRNLQVPSSNYWLLMIVRGNPFSIALWRLGNSASWPSFLPALVMLSI